MTGVLDDGNLRGSRVLDYRFREGGAGELGRRAG